MTKEDNINSKILRALSVDGRISNLALAEQVGLSPSEVRMQRRGPTERTFAGSAIIVLFEFR